MKLAIVGSRNVIVDNMEKYISACDEIISGGAKGVDACAAEYAKENGIKLSVILPKYKHYGKAAPIIRNKEIVDSCDYVIAFWDGSSKGTLSVIRYSEKTRKPYKLIFVNMQ